MVDELIHRAKMKYLEDLITEGEARERNLLSELDRLVSDVSKAEVMLELKLAESETYETTVECRQDKHNIQVMRIELNNAYTVRENDLNKNRSKRELIKRQLEELKAIERDGFTAQIG